MNVTTLWLAVFVVSAAVCAYLPEFLTHRGGSQDLYIYRAGAGLALAGRSPYDRAALHQMIAAKFPEQPLLIENHGFFLAPAGVAIYAPLALLPWGVAKTAWAVLSYALAGFAAWHLVPLAGAAARRLFDNWRRAVVMAVALWDPLIFIGTAVGQTAAVMTGCLILGEVARRRGRPWLAAALWGVLFAKPHLSLPLVPLAAYLGGRRQGSRVAVAAGVLTLIGVAICGGPHVVGDFFAHLRDSHKAVEFNKVTWNPQLLSWNRPFYALTGRPIELGATEVLAGYALFALAVAVRVRVAGSRPTPAWALAAAVVAACECCQLLASEAFLLIAVLPHLLDTFAANRRLAAAWLILGLIVKSLPIELSWAILEWRELSAARQLVIESPRGFGVLILASGLLATGWRK